MVNEPSEFELLRLDCTLQHLMILFVACRRFCSVCASWFGPSLSTSTQNTDFHGSKKLATRWLIELGILYASRRIFLYFYNILTLGEDLVPVNRFNSPSPPPFPPPPHTHTHAVGFTTDSFKALILVLVGCPLLGLVPSCRADALLRRSVWW